jgi:hypothetical protein
MDTIPPEALIAGYPDHIQEIAQLLRREILRAVPDAIERVRPGWGLIGYDVPIHRRTAYFGFVWPEVVHVHLGFEHGILMHDPERRLQGSGKKLRWLTFTNVAEVDRATVTPLIEEAARIAGLPREQRLVIALDREICGDRDDDG